MSGQFLKIFLWFWGAMIALIVTFALTTAHLGGKEIPPMLEHARKVFQTEADEIRSQLNDKGMAGFRERIEREGMPRFMRIFIVTPDGRDLLGSRLPPPLRAFAFMPEQYLGRDPAVREGQIEVMPMFLRRQGYARLIMVFRPPSPIWHLLTYQRLGLALLVSGLVCWALAAYLTAPVRTLRRLTRRLADGELDTRADRRITRRHDELGGLAGDFNAMAGRLQDLIESRQRLLADISHELRSPLARLQLALGLARRHNDEQLVETQLDRIEREANRLNDLIGQVLTLTRLDRIQDAAMEQLDLRELLQAIVEDAGFEAGERDCQVELEAGPAVFVRANPELLHSAIENVVRNALRHTPPGGVVTVFVTSDQTAVSIEVRDQGEGIDEALLEQVFEPFFRVDEARSRGKGGIGLGLSIARRAIELHQGKISARNTDKGLAVSIVLPREHILPDHAGDVAS